MCKKTKRKQAWRKNFLFAVVCNFSMQVTKMYFFSLSKRLNFEFHSCGKLSTMQRKNSYLPFGTYAIWGKTQLLTEKLNSKNDFYVAFEEKHLSPLLFQRKLCRQCRSKSLTCNLFGKISQKNYRKRKKTTKQFYLTIFLFPLLHLPIRNETFQKRKSLKIGEHAILVPVTKLSWRNFKTDKKTVGNQDWQV